MKAYTDPNRIWQIEWRIKVTHYHSHRLYVIEYPVEIIQRRYWVVRWINALLQVRFPRHHIVQYVGMKKKAISQKDSQAFKIRAAKGQVTKVKNLIQKYKDGKAKTLFPVDDTDVILIKLQNKLQDKEKIMDSLLNKKAAD